MSTPNVIPMADIMLVLLIIFMVVTPMLQKTTRWTWRRQTTRARCAMQTKMTPWLWP
jgi:biopolymer transport protein ExbD